jgi:hypothetical protein
METVTMTTMTEQIKIDGSGNAYLSTGDGLEFLGWWNPSLRQFTFENGDVWDVDPTATIENFLASFPSDEETAEFESLQEREELADLGLYDQAGGVCELCTAVTQAGSLCEPCAAFTDWHDEHFGSWWS